jgi:hypothetical protein
MISSAVRCGSRKNRCHFSLPDPEPVWNAMPRLSSGNDPDQFFIFVPASGIGTFETCRRALKMCSLGKTGSDRSMMKATRFTQNGHSLLICPNDVGTESNRDVPSQLTVEALGDFGVANKALESRAPNCSAPHSPQSSSISKGSHPPASTRSTDGREPRPSSTNRRMALERTVS